MSPETRQTSIQSPIQIERYFKRFSLRQRLEHLVLLLCVGVLLATGLPQKYRSMSWSLSLLSSPERLERLQTIHHIAAVGLTLLGLYLAIRTVVLLFQKKLSGDMLPVVQDLRDAGQMLRYLFFLTENKPKFGKYNFEQKFTYWFLFFSIGLMVVSGFLIWFPIFFTRLLPGGIIPAALHSHSTEAVVTGVFILIWHFYHVHIERLNLSVFSGKLSDTDMRSYHAREYERLVNEANLKGNEVSLDTGEKP